MESELQEAAANMRVAFPFAGCYLANVPSYPGSLWSFLIAGKQASAATLFAPEAPARARGTIARRFRAAALTTRYYTPELHFGSFALPRFIAKALERGVEA
jgi:spermidine synthase